MRANIALRNFRTFVFVKNGEVVDRLMVSSKTFVQFVPSAQVSYFAEFVLSRCFLVLQGANPQRLRELIEEHM